MRAQMFSLKQVMLPPASLAQRLIASGGGSLTPLAPWKKVAKNGDDIRLLVPSCSWTGRRRPNTSSRGGLSSRALAATGLSAGRVCVAWMWPEHGAVSPLIACYRPVRLQVIGIDRRAFTASCSNERLKMTNAWSGVEGFNARALTPELLEKACDEAPAKSSRKKRTTTLQPIAPYAWMRNGGQVPMRTT